MMDQTLKNRLVGVVVLLVLAVVLLPMLFDGANEKALLADTRMPVPPAVPEAETLLAEPPSTIPEAEAEIALAHAPAEPEAVVPATAAPATPAMPAGPAPVVAVPAPVPPVAAPPPAATPPADARLAALAEAWDLQVAAVSTRDSAEKLRARLTLAGYKARVVDGGKLFRVLVGPELRRADVDALKTKLAADGRVGKPVGLPVRYVP